MNDNALKEFLLEGIEAHLKVKNDKVFVGGVTEESPGWLTVTVDPKTAAAIKQLERGAIREIKHIGGELELD